MVLFVVNHVDFFQRNKSHIILSFPIPRYFPTSRYDVIDASPSVFSTSIIMKMVTTISSTESAETDGS